MRFNTTKLPRIALLILVIMCLGGISFAVALVHENSRDRVLFGFSTAISLFAFFLAGRRSASGADEPWSDLLLTSVGALVTGLTLLFDFEACILARTAFVAAMALAVLIGTFWPS